MRSRRRPRSSRSGCGTDRDEPPWSATSLGTDHPEALVRPPFATRFEPARDSVDPFRDVVCRIFPEKTTVFRENPKLVGCLRISFRAVRTLVRLNFWTTRTRGVGSHAWSQTKSGHGRDSACSCASL